jgi:hypothetical protein
VGLAGKLMGIISIYVNVTVPVPAVTEYTRYPVTAVFDVVTVRPAENVAV